MLRDLRSQLVKSRYELEHRRTNLPGEEAPEERIAVERYFDPAIHEAEIRHLFRGLPLVVAHSSEIEPGQVLTHDQYGLPLLVTRDRDGAVACFLNVCRHRGMRLVEDAHSARAKASVVCPYHGWSYRLDGTLRHMPHAETFDAGASGMRDLVPLPCEERHGLIWVVLQPGARLDLDAFLSGVGEELDRLGVAGLMHFRTTVNEYEANWKLIVDAFLESYHIRVLHRESIYRFFTDGIYTSSQLGPHVHSLVARRPAVEWAKAAQPDPPDIEDLCRIATPTQVIFPNTITIFHPDYLSLVSVYPTGPERFRWIHRMLIPPAKSDQTWLPYWEKTFNLMEQRVFQKEDIHCAVEIQRGLRTGANRWLTVGRMEQGVSRFHQTIQDVIGC
jgi:phenylpropionate dioxygenase-like ring-hydroxylating dioxygenase large terminal subunit